MKEILLIFMGGGLGSVLRYLGQNLVHPRMESICPFFSWGTFTVNIVGCLLIGLFYTVSERWALSLETRLFLTTGLCGGFTTFSTFTNEGLHLLKHGNYALFISYVGLSMGLGLLAVWIGGCMGKHLSF